MDDGGVSAINDVRVRGRAASRAALPPLAAEDHVCTFCGLSYAQITAFAARRVPLEGTPNGTCPASRGLVPARSSRPINGSLTATAPFHRRAEDLDWQAALLPRVRSVSGWCRARRPLNKEVWQGREERRQGRLCGSRSDLIGRQRGRSSRRYQFGAGAGS
jgi:hypothetical protein